jgi:hypothetical protein
MANPLIPQGTLNRILGTVQIVDIPTLSITEGFMGEEMISISPDGPASDYIKTQTGAVPSGRPYQPYTIMVHLLRSQGLAALWEQQRSQNTNIGDVVVTPDSPTLGPYTFNNCSLINVNEMTFNGMGDDYPLVIQGTLPINAALFT